MDVETVVADVERVVLAHRVPFQNLPGPGPDRAGALQPVPQDHLAHRLQFRAGRLEQGLALMSPPLGQQGVAAGHEPFAGKVRVRQLEQRAPIEQPHLDRAVGKQPGDPFRAQRGNPVQTLNAHTHRLLREHVRQKRGGYRVRPEDNPKKTPLTTIQLLARARRAGTHIGALCEGIHQRQGEAAVRRILGLLSLAKRYGVAAVEDASAAALELHVYEYRFVRRYLERRPPLTLRQVDPLIRELTQYRDLINLRIQEQEHS